jgi:hypothetical protein
MSDEPMTGQEAIADAESTTAATEATATAETTAATEATATAETTAPPEATAEATATTVDQAAHAQTSAAAPVVPARRARTLALTILGRVLRFAVAVGLLAVGVVLGWQVYLTNLPPPAIAGDPAVAGVPAPAGVAELANAIAADDADAIRSALHQDMFARYTSEMERFGIATVDSVDTQATYADGPRTATALILHGSTVDRNPFTINLVVVTQDGQIVRLR